MLNKISLLGFLTAVAFTNLDVKRVTGHPYSSDEERFELGKILLESAESAMENGLGKDRDSLAEVYGALFILAAEGLTQTVSGDEALDKLIEQINFSRAAFGLDPLFEGES